MRHPAYLGKNVRATSREAVLFCDTQFTAFDQSTRNKWFYVRAQEVLGVVEDFDALASESASVCMVPPAGKASLGNNPLQVQTRQYIHGTFSGFIFIIRYKAGSKT